MRKNWQKLAVGMTGMIAALSATVLGALPVMATEPSTSILDPTLDVEGILNLVLKILVYGLGAAATLGVVIAGIIYMTARDNPQQVAIAKKRLIDIIIGLAVWALMYTLLNWLVPGSLNINV